jgi:transcription elongation GreA/GreB family factor
MMKELVLKKLRSQVQLELENAQRARDSITSYNKSGDLKQEGKYDTRAIEAGYLAGAQNKRVEELKLELKLLDEISLGHSPDSVSVGALVELEINQKGQLYFLSSTAGGTVVEVEGKPVMVISVFSPLGSELVDLCLGDEFELETPKGIRSYKIQKIY